MKTCGWCQRRIIGRHRIVEPYSFRGWNNDARAGLPIMLDVALVFHKTCWHDVVRIARDAEHVKLDGRPEDLFDLADEPYGMTCDCGETIWAGTDHSCSVGTTTG